MNSLIRLALNQDIAIVMVAIFGAILVGIAGLVLIQKVHNEGTYFPSPQYNKIKYEFEVYALVYTAVWIGVFAVVIILQLYEKFDEKSYLYLCVSLDLPFLLQPILFPLPAESKLPLFQRYSFKANVWIWIFAYVGSYWYTHYFYCVLKARYTFPSWRLNDVPVALYFAAHFYFVTYHTLSNMILRKIESRFEGGWRRSALFWGAVLAFSYFTAFMETFSISSFPYYAFEDRFMAYTLGSAFYGIYFIVSFPTFYRLDEHTNSRATPKALSAGVAAAPHSLYQTVMEAAGASMIVLCLLDAARLWLGIELTVSGRAVHLYRP